MISSTTDNAANALAESGSTRSVPLWFVIAAWIAMIVFLFARLAMYSQSPGALGAPPMAVVAGLETAPDGYTLAVAIHPKCPCTQSTIYELQRLVPKTDNPLHFVFCVYTGKKSPDSWYEESAAMLQTRFPGSTIINDIDGSVADKLGAVISGSTVLYNSDGTPVFWGGVTSGRGHSGDNLGSDSIIAIVNGEEPPRATTAVYGCEITQNNANHLLGTCLNTTSGVCEEPHEVTMP